MCFDYKNFAESIKYFHPTLQQSLFRLIREIIYVQADDERYYDARNIASHEIAKKLVKVIATECLPYI
jgi:isoleucyl-tRNA synthetase